MNNETSIKDTEWSEQTPLTNMQERFVEEYQKDLNGPMAAKRAGYAPTFKVSRLLAMTKIQEAIARKMAEREKRTNITADRVLTELARLAFATLPDIMSWKTDEKSGEIEIEVKNSEDLTTDVAAAISEITYTKKPRGISVLKVKLYSKPDALKTLAKHLGLTDGKTPGGDESIDDKSHKELMEMLRAQGVEVHTELAQSETLNRLANPKIQNDPMGNVLDNLDDGFEVTEIDETLEYGEEEHFEFDPVEDDGNVETVDFGAGDKGKSNDVVEEKSDDGQDSFYRLGKKFFREKSGGNSANTDTVK